MSSLLLALSLWGGVLDPSKVQIETEYFRHHFRLGILTSSVNTSLGSALGFGPSISYTYGLDSNWGLSTSIASIYDSRPSDGGFSPLFFGFAGTIRYAFRGSFVGFRQSVRMDPYTIVEEISRREPLWSMGLSAEQLILNGREAAYPATGFGLGTTYEFSAWRRSYQTGGKIGILSARGTSLQTITFFIGVVLH